MHSFVHVAHAVIGMSLCLRTEQVRIFALTKKECESKDCSANKRVCKYYAGRDRFPRAHPGVTGLTTLSLEPFGRPLPGLRGFFSPEAVGAVLPADQARSLSSGSASQGSARGRTDSAATPRHNVFAGCFVTRGGLAPVIPAGRPRFLGDAGISESVVLPLLLLANSQRKKADNGDPEERAHPPLLMHTVGSKEGAGETGGDDITGVCGQ